MTDPNRPTEGVSDARLAELAGAYWPDGAAVFGNEIASCLKELQKRRDTRSRLPIITVQMLGDLGREGFFEKTDEPVKGVKGVSWSQAAVDFACLLNVPVVQEPRTPGEPDKQHAGKVGE